MIFKKNGSDSQFNDNKNLENSGNRMFNSNNFNGFNTSRGSFSNRDSILHNQNNNNNNLINNDGLAKSKLKLMNIDSPIKLKINKDSDKTDEFKISNDGENQNNYIKMNSNDVFNKNTIFSDNSEENLNRKNSVRRSINMEEETVSPKLEK